MENNTDQPPAPPVEEPSQPVVPPIQTENPTPENPEGSTPPLSSGNRLDSILKNKKMLILGGSGLLILIILLLFVRLLLPSSSTNTAGATPTPSATDEITVTPTEDPNVTSSPTTGIMNRITPTVTPTGKPSSLASPTTKPPSATNTPSPTSKPTGPPKMIISFPTEGQSFTLDSSQTFCAIDIPSGSPSFSDGLQRRENTGSGWSDYHATSTFCYSPTNGSNTLQFQYKNSDGIESAVQSVNFTFQRI